MYGQTEATARMGYLPPELVERHPQAIGRPIPGGSFELVAVDDQPADVGELVYRGPNVMMGYAVSDADLARRRDGRGAAHRRPRPPSRRRRRLRDRRATGALRQAVRAAHRPRRAGGRPRHVRRWGRRRRRRRPARGRRPGRLGRRHPPASRQPIRVAGRAAARRHRATDPAHGDREGRLRRRRPARTPRPSGRSPLGAARVVGGGRRTRPCSGAPTSRRRARSCPWAATR